MRNWLQAGALLGVFALLAFGLGIHPFKYLEEAYGLFVRSGTAQITEPEQRMWIVLTFQGENGREVRMSFDNPAVPRMRPSRCQEVLSGATPDLVRVARETSSLAARLPFVRSECIASETDPLRPG